MEIHILFFVAAAINSLAGGGGLTTFPLLALVVRPLAVAVVFVVALYGGYFGAGIGILMISALGLMGTGCLRGVAVLVLIAEGTVNWGYGLPMVFGGLVGGYLGGMASGRVDRSVLRAVVLVTGFCLAAYYFWSLYGPPELRVGGE